MASPQPTISLEGNDAPDPIETFSDCDLHPSLMLNISKARYDQPTSVQKYAIPTGLIGRDLMASAQTGSGKTAAFLFPIIHQLLTNKVTRGTGRKEVCPSVLVLAPTRELASQIQTEAEKFVHGTSLVSCVVYGGAMRGPQVQAIRRRGVDILIATPGRLMDFLNLKHLSLSAVKFLVLDEADRMLDMGFEPDIRNIVCRRDMPTERQTLMFSATFPKAIRQLASEFMKNYLFLSVGRVGSATSNVTQQIKNICQTQKMAELVKDLGAIKGQVVVFTEKKSTATQLADTLWNQGFYVDCLHSDRAQNERERVLKAFKDAKLQILIGTDVIGRGLDVEGVSHVINYDLPKAIDSYVHHVGRTGRAGNTGFSISYYTSRDAALAKDLVKVLSETKQEIPLFLSSAASASKSHNTDRNGRWKGRAGGRGGRGGVMRRNTSRGANPY